MSASPCDGRSRCAGQKQGAGWWTGLWFKLNQRSRSLLVCMCAPVETMSGWLHQRTVWEAAEKKQLLPHSRINIDCNLMSYSNPTTRGWVWITSPWIPMHYLYVGLLSPQLQEEVVNMPRWAGHLSLSFSLSDSLSPTHPPSISSLSPSLSLALPHSLSPSFFQSLDCPLCPLCFLGDEKWKDVSCVYLCIQIMGFLS